jgi:hypothetical protein
MSCFGIVMNSKMKITMEKATCQKKRKKEKKEKG